MAPTFQGRYPGFSQGLAQDPTTRRIWYSIATAHDFESHDGMTEETLYQKVFASHFGQLAIIFLWTAGNLFFLFTLFLKEYFITYLQESKILV